MQQEIANARFALSPPSPKLEAPARLAPLPDPTSLRPLISGSSFAREVEELASSILEHRFPLLGHVIETGPEIRWRRDYLRGIETEAAYFRRIPYLDAARAGDHKIIWELNRHQHLVVLAQAWLLSGRREYTIEIDSQLSSWWDQNPFCRGINWASALEVAFRALSWVWIYHLAGAGLAAGIRRRLLLELYRHGAYLERNLSIYFSPNTHLLGEAVALHALGALFPDWPRSRRWREIGARTTAAQMQFQVREDGSHFEQSTAYHVYAVDFFLFHALLAPVDGRYQQGLSRMADYLAALGDAGQRIPLLGDDDGGRLFHPYGDRRRFGAATLASCAAYLGRSDLPSRQADLRVQAAWWMGEEAANRPDSVAMPMDPRLFRDARVAVLSQAPVQLIADTRAFGYGGAGHSHAHALSIVCRKAGEDVLFDSGTFTYVGSPELRDQFRGTAAHNTVTVDGADQAEPSGSFRWKNLPRTQILDWRATPRYVYLQAECRTAKICHVRHIVWVAAASCFAVLDLITGPGEHRVEQAWHSAEVTAVKLGSFCISCGAALRVPAEAGVETRTEEAWQSEVPGHRVRRRKLVVSKTGRLPVLLPALFCLEGEQGIHLEVTPEGVTLETPVVAVRFQRNGEGLRFIGD